MPTKPPLTPLAIVKLPKAISAMSDKERHAFALKIYKQMAKAHKPVVAAKSTKK